MQQKGGCILADERTLEVKFGRIQRKINNAIDK